MNLDELSFQQTSPYLPTISSDLSAVIYRGELAGSIFVVDQTSILPIPKGDFDKLIRLGGADATEDELTLEAIRDTATKAKLKLDDGIYAQLASILHAARFGACEPGLAGWWCQLWQVGVADRPVSLRWAGFPGPVGLSSRRVGGFAVR